LRGVVSSKGVGSVHMNEVMAMWLVERETLSRSQRAARKLGYNMMTGLSLASTALRVWRISRNHIQRSPQCPMYIADLCIAVGAALAGDVGDPDAVVKHANGDRTALLWNRDVVAMYSKVSFLHIRDDGH